MKGIWKGYKRKKGYRGKILGIVQMVNKGKMSRWNK